jgi:phage terminase large subunit-like protein
VPRGPWYISARAVREYAALTGLGDADDESVFAAAEEELIAIAEETVASGRRPRRLRTGALVYRGPRPRRLRLVVVTEPRPEGPLPQLVRVLPEYQR